MLSSPPQLALHVLLTLTLTTTGLRTQVLSGSHARARSALRLTWKNALRALRVLPAEAPGGVVQFVVAGPLWRSRSSPQTADSLTGPQRLSITTYGPARRVLIEVPGAPQLKRPPELAVCEAPPLSE